MIYTPTYKWNESNADIQGDLAAMAEDLRINGLPATEVLVGRNVARTFLKNKEILDLLNNRRVEIGKWAPHSIYHEATLLTSLNCYGNDLDIISYLGSYENEAGVNVDEYSKVLAKEVNIQMPVYSKLSAIEKVDTPFEKTPKMSIKRFMYK